MTTALTPDQVADAMPFARALGVEIDAAAPEEVTVHLDDGRGHAVSDAVVMLIPDAAPAAASAPPAPATHVVDQRDETFVPYVQLLRPGDEVVFRNSDSTRHHVYSFAAIRTFEFVLRPGESSPALVMDKSGIAAVGCNIHDHMITYLFVSAVPAIALSGGDGNATIAHLAPGRYTARATWVSADGHRQSASFGFRLTR